MKTMRIALALGALMGCAHSPPQRPVEGPMCVTVQRDMYAGVRTVCAEDVGLIERFLARHGGDR